MITRRQFIKTGAILLPMAGIAPSNAFARWWAMQGDTTSGGTSVAWGKWSETSEVLTGFNVTLYNGGADTDETGVGIVTGANLVHSRQGAPGAAVNDGGYYYRPMDGTDDGFTVTGGWFDGIFAGKSEWFFAIKCYIDSTDRGVYPFIINGGVSSKLATNFEAGNVLRFSCQDTENAQEDKDTTDAITDNSVIWICMWTGGGITRAGYYVPAVAGTHPTKWSDFEANKRVQFAALFDNFAAITGLEANQSIYFQTLSGFNKGRIYAIVASNTNPINNGA